jgi:cytochrome c oxidase subunit I
MSTAVAKRTSHSQPVREPVSAGRTVLGAIVGYLLTATIIYLFRRWAQGVELFSGSEWDIKEMLGLGAPGKITFAYLAGAILGGFAGAYRPGLVLRDWGFLKAWYGAALGYAIGAAATMLVRMAFDMPAYSERPVFVFASVCSFLGWIWGLGGWNYWAGYVAGRPTPEHEDHSSHGARRGWRDYLIFNTDHKVIGLQYIVTTVAFMLVGGFLAEMIRAELARPGIQVFTDGSAYNQVMSMHGIIMLFLFIIPVFAGIANYVLPIMIGAPDMAFPRLNALSYWTFLFGGLVFMAGFIVGLPEAGWTNYAPLSSAAGNAPIGIGQMIWLIGIQIVGASSILTAINFIVTIITMRAPGMSMWRMPLLVWANFTTSMLVVFGTPFVAGSQFMVMFDAVMGTKFFTGVAGGDPIAYQHIFWFYSHPAVYIMMLPGFGIISEVITTHARKPIFGYKALAVSTAAIGILGFTVWAHHMFTSGMAEWLRLPMMITTMLIAVPTGVKVLGWSATLWKARIHLTTGMLFAVGFLFTFTVGGLTGVMLAAVPFDQHVQDTYFVVAHFHYVLFGGSVFTVFAGLYHWFPKMTGRMYSESLGKLHFWLTFVGMNLTFFPMHWLGTMGMPRRVADYEQLATDMPSAAPWNFVATVGALIQGIAFCVFLYNMAASWRQGPRAPGNPWRSRTLEWLVSSPPPLFNFHDTPLVTGAPYDFGVQGAVHAVVKSKEEVQAEHAAAGHGSAH